jgi:thioredoxin-dependent peroxiredoxin
MASYEATNTAGKKETAMAQLNIGDKAPPFALKDQDGTHTSLADLSGRKLLLYFYPKADTPGCTKQACSVRDAMENLADAGLTAVGISPDEPKKQKKFDEKYNLGFPLLSDPDHQVARAYGAWGEKSMYGKTYEGIIRSSFLIDEKGNILQVSYKVKPQNTVPNARQALSGKNSPKAVATDTNPSVGCPVQ